MSSTIPKWIADALGIDGDSDVLWELGEGGDHAKVYPTHD